MSVGILASQMRLHRKDIYCIAPSTINTCGAINVVSLKFHCAYIASNIYLHFVFNVQVCFDKTGTLTEDGLDFHSVCPVVQSNSKEPLFRHEYPSLNVKEMWDYRKLVEAVSTCHSLTRLIHFLHSEVEVEEIFIQNFAFNTYSNFVLNHL